MEKIREFFSKDRFATDNGAVIDEVGDNYARVSLTIGESVFTCAADAREARRGRSRRSRRSRYRKTSATSARSR